MKKKVHSSEDVQGLKGMNPNTVILNEVPQPNRAYRRKEKFAEAHAEQIAKAEKVRLKQLNASARSRRLESNKRDKALAKRAERTAKRAEIAKEHGVSPKRVLLVGTGYTIKPSKPVRAPKRDTPKWARIKGTSV